MFIRLQSTPGLINRTLITANGNIVGLSTSFKNVADNMNSRITELKPTLDNFKTLSDSLKLIQLNGTMTKAQEAIGKLNETLAKFNSGDNTVSKLMNEDSLYVNLNKLVNSFDSLANHINQNPKHFMGPLGKSRKKIERELKEQREEEAERKKKAGN
jgi:phospholipid/cholesterol/gamma-HCH transport system substrate-binding protein